ncbi:MAG: triose-phosphate isomerase [archaeon]
MIKFFAGNWKMNKNKEEAATYMRKFKQLVQDTKSEIVIAPPFTLLETVSDACKGSKIKVAAQNIYFESDGAYTGEISSDMVKDFAEYVIIGHSERRKYFAETDEMINKKIKAALLAGLKVIFCLGENLTQREKGDAKKVVEHQLLGGLKDLNELNDIIIAYEPVWAIGTGKNATPEQAEEIHAFIKLQISKFYGKSMANGVKIIYGGSVNPENSKAILKMKNIDGCLPGGASLDPVKFSQIIHSV